MFFTSHAFLLIFLPITFFIYYKLCKTPDRKMLFLLIISYCFYALAGWKFIPVLLGLSLLTFLAGTKNWLFPGILLNLAALILFKYWNFGVENLDTVLQYFNLKITLNLLTLGLPLGISFLVFKHMGYLLDIQAGRYPASRELFVFLTFSAYFPQISSGPISSFKDTSVQLKNLPDHLENQQILHALIHFSMGLAKKVLIADQIGKIISIENNGPIFLGGTLPAWYMLIAFAIQIYFDFSGYTDMALGISGLFGVKLPPNFNNPYLAADPGQFWERWHMSLSNWFRVYLFSPISRLTLRKWGAERREWAQFVTNLVTMGLIGLWHGSTWVYLLWGIYHGLLLNLNAAWKRRAGSIPGWLGRPLFMVSILLGWGLFMSPNISFFKDLLENLFGMNGFGSSVFLDLVCTSNATISMIAGILLAFSGRGEAASVIHSSPQINGWNFFLWGSLCAICTLIMGQSQNFIYNGF
jgi:alginate O-acetyltransferase complex protein AlgI